MLKIRKGIKINHPCTKIGKLFVVYSLLLLLGSTYTLTKALLYAFSLLILLLVLLSSNKRHISTPVLLIICFCVLYFFTGILNGEIEYILKLEMSFIVQSIPLIVFNYFYKRDHEELLRIFKYSIIVYLILLVIYAVYFFTNPFIARATDNNGVYGNDVILGSGYFFTYSVVFFLICHVLFYVDKNGSLYKKIILYFLCFVIIFYTGSSITLYVSASCFSLALVSSKFKKGRRWLFILLSIIIALILILAYQELGKLFLRIGDVSGNIVEQRFYEMGQKIVFGRSTDDGMDARLNTLQRSLDGFLYRPVFGIGYLVGNNNVLAKSISFGGHSQFLDDLALFGIIGFLLRILVYVFSFQRIHSLDDEPPLLSLVICFILMGFLNPLYCEHVNYVLFFLAPAYLIYKREKNPMKQR